MWEWKFCFLFQLIVSLFYYPMNTVENTKNGLSKNMHFDALLDGSSIHFCIHLKAISQGLNSGSW